MVTGSTVTGTKVTRYCHWYRVQVLLSLRKLKKISQKDQMTDLKESKLFLL